MPKKWTKEELVAAGIPESFRLGSNHPQMMASSWDIPDLENRLFGVPGKHRFPHLRPQSVLITCIGNLWEKDSWWHLQDMMLATARAGYSMSIQEVDDPTMFSHDAIPMMRWYASMLARDGGVEWCLMVDTDTLVEKDTLLKLLAHDRPVVFPYLEDLEERYPVQIAPMSAPPLKPGMGLVPVRWSAMSVMLFNAKIFNVLEPKAWEGTDYVFGQALSYLGHRIYVDTDTVVKVVKGPARLASMPYEEYWAGHKKMRHRLQFEPRDRRPPPGFDPLKDDGFVDPDGTYFAVPHESNVHLNGNGVNP